jgi:AcrR family transcriptional regulator
MAAPRNDEERDRIYDAALKLFFARGFNKTSYANIADACQTSKSMVQHYFPKKELFIDRYFSQTLDDLNAHAVELADDPEDVLEVFCLMGLMHFSQLLSSGKLRALADDIVESRTLTNSIMVAERAWAAERLPERRGVVSAADALTVSLGGAYELIYQYRQAGQPLTAGYVERAAVVPFALTMGFDRQCTEDTLQACEKKLAQRAAER